MRKGGKLEGWKAEKLGDVIQKTETINPLQTPNKEFIYIDVSSVNNKTLSIEETSLIKGKDAPSRARKLIKTGDVIFATVRPTLKRIAVISEEYDHQVCSTGYFVLRGKEFINNKYLFYYLQTDSFNERMEKLQKGASYPAVTDTEVKEQIISYPPLPEQQRIVSVLDEAFASIAGAKSNAERNLVNARELFESVLQSSFENAGKDWEIKKLGELYSFKNGINFDKTQKIGKGILTVDVLNMYNEGTQVDLSQLYRVNKEVSGEYILKNGDILIVRSSVKKEGVAWATFFRETDEPITFCGFIIRGRPIEKLNPEYIVHFLRSSVTREKLIKTATQSTITNINQQNLSQLIVPVPSLAEQRAIVGRLEALSAETGRLEEIYQQKVESLDELKKSVLGKAFSGEL